MKDKLDIVIITQDDPIYIPKPDVIFSVSAPQILKKNLIKLPNWGCINVHTAKLPEYRGMVPNFWAMYHG